MIVRKQLRRGLGDVCSDGPGAPFSWQRIKYTTMLCGTSPITQLKDAASTAASKTVNAILPGQYMPLPTAPAPTVALSTDPAAANLPGAQYAGDEDGTPVYAVPETAQENQARYKAGIDQYMEEQGQRTPPDDFMTKYGTALAIGGAVLGALLLFNATGGRR